MKTHVVKCLSKQKKKLQRVQQPQTHNQSNVRICASVCCVWQPSHQSKMQRTFEMQFFSRHSFRSVNAPAVLFGYLKFQFSSVYQTSKKNNFFFLSNSDTWSTTTLICFQIQTSNTII